MELERARLRVHMCVHICRVYYLTFQPSSGLEPRMSMYISLQIQYRYSYSFNLQKLQQTFAWD